jgi:hypothetical protein
MTSDTTPPESFRVLSRAVAEWSCGAVPALLVVLGGAGAIFLAPPLSSMSAALGLLGLLAFVVPGRLCIGADSITLRWLWTVRTMYFDEVEVVARYEERVSWVVGLRFDLRSGVLLVPMRMPIGMRLLYRLLPGHVWGGPEVELARQAVEYAAELRAKRLASAPLPPSGGSA